MIDEGKFSLFPRCSGGGCLRKKGREEGKGLASAEGGRVRKRKRSGNGGGGDRKERKQREENGCVGVDDKVKSVYSEGKCASLLSQATNPSHASFLS